MSKSKSVNTSSAQGSDIFISYVEEDARIVLQLAEGLEAAGYTTWYYERDSLPGPSYLLQIIQAIEQSQAFLLVISPDSLGSHQVTREIERAHEIGKPFVPVLFNITHVDFQQRQLLWNQALGTATSISIQPEDIGVTLPRIVAGLKALGIQPSEPLLLSELQQDVNIPDGIADSSQGAQILISREEAFPQGVNPYLNRVMIRNIAHFFGRKGEINNIYTRLGAAQPQSIAIVGDRRVGKSSLLYFISHPSNRARYLPNPERFAFVFLDFQMRRNITISDFFERLFEQLKQETKDSIQMPTTADYDGLIEVVEELKSRGLKLVLLLDEFERVTYNPEFDAEFYAFLRALANSYNVAYVTSSGKPLQELCHSKQIADSPFFNVFTPCRLGPFLPEETLALISEPSEAAGIPLAPYAEKIIEMSGHLPFFVQIACSAFFEHLQRDERLTDEAMSDVYDRFFEEAIPHFEYFWQNFTQSEQQRCVKLAEDLPIERSEQRRIRNLVQRGYVCQRGEEYRLFSSGFKEYVIMISEEM